jgi:hypothetical protein
MPVHQPDGDHDTQGLSSPSRLFDLVSRCQELSRQLEQTSDPVQRAEFKGELDAAGQDLWAALREPLMRRIRRRISGALRDALQNPASYPTYNDAVEALAMSSMLGLFEALPRISLDPAKNAQAYLTTIAWYGLIDMENQVYDAQLGKGAQVPIILVSIESVLQAIDDDRLYEEVLRDERMPSVDEQVIDMQFSHALAIFFASALSAEDRLIVLARLQTPPEPYNSIVARLGKGWTTDAARQRFRRAMQRTRVYLQMYEWI